MTDIVDVDANVLFRIDLMCIVLVSGVVFIHVPLTAVTSPFNGAFHPHDWFRVLLRDNLFRVGGPCLSAIAGYLLFRNGATSFDDRAAARRTAGIFAHAVPVAVGAICLHPAQPQPFPSKGNP